MTGWTEAPPASIVVETTSPDATTWSTLDSLFVLLGAFLIYIVGSVIVGVIDFGIEGRHIGFWLIPASYLFLTGGTYFMATWWLIGRRQATWRSIGFRLPQRRSWLAGVGKILLVAFVAFICIEIGSDIIVGLFNMTSFHIKSNVKELLPPGQSTIDLGQYLVLVAIGAVVAPITEETLFRGVVYQGMRRDGSRPLGSIVGIIVAAVASGFLFGAFHLIGGSQELYTLPLLAFLGVVLAFAFQYADSLAASIIVHAVVNFSSITYLFAHTH